MRKASLIACLLLMFIRHGLAQSKLTILGMVQDSTGAALTYATVIITSEKDSLSAITKEDGHFKLAVSQAKSFALQVTMKGYLPYKKQYVTTTKSAILELKPIVLKTDYHELAPVIVSRVRPVMIGEDTITYNAAAFHVRDGSEVDAILKRLPGVEVDMDGNVIVQGKKVSKVMVDGKLFFGGDVLTATRNLPAEIVDKLQIIDDYGDKARLTGVKSGESDKVLNIVLKQDKRHGQFGHVDSGIGNQGRYIGEVFGNSFAGEQQLALSAGVKNNSLSGKNIQKNGGFSYADRWGPTWKSEANIGLSGSDSHASSSSIQDSYYSGGQTHQEQSTQTTGSSRNANFESTLTYTPDKFNALYFSPSISIQHSVQSSVVNFSTVQQTNGLTRNSNGHSLSKTSSDTYSTGSDLYYQQLSRHSKSRFSARLKVNYSNDKQLYDNHLYTTVELDSVHNLSEQRYFINNPNIAWNLGVNMNYYIPMGKTGFVELGYDWYNGLSHKSRSTLEQDSLHVTPVAIDSLRQDYIYHSMYHHFRGGYTANIHNLGLTISMDAEPGSFNGNTAGNGKNIQYQYFNWTPVVQASFSISKSKRLDLHYSGSPSLPGLDQVQPVTDLTNPQYPLKGNPGLRPSYTQSVNLHYEQSFLKSTQFWGFGVSMGYNVTQHSIIQNIVHPKDSSIIIQSTTYLNAGNLHSLNAGYHLTIPALLQKRLKITLNGQLARGAIPSMTDNILYMTSSLNASQGLHLQFMIPECIESDLSGNYNLTHTWYSAGNGTPVSFAGAEWSLNNRHYIWRHWILNYQLSQSYTGLRGYGLQKNPPSMTASLQREFLRKNRAVISIVGYDLLNTSSGITQSFSATNVTKSQTTLTGRYFFVQFLLKFSKFHE
jgi:hypothetical protein